jgi:transposase
VDTLSHHQLSDNLTWRARCGESRTPGSAGGPGKTERQQCRNRAPDRPNWRPSKASSTDKAVTVMVDLTRDEHGCLRARLLDAVQGRSGKVFADWLTGQGVEVTVTVEHAALDPFRGYANAIRDELPAATAVLDAFHVVKLAGNALDEVRRRVQQETLARRGHKDNPAVQDPPHPAHRP